MDDEPNNTPLNIITSTLSSDSFPSLESLSTPSPLPISLTSPIKRKRQIPNSISSHIVLDSSYLEHLSKVATIDFKGLHIKTKCPDEKFVVPTICDYHLLLSYKYKKDQLKTIAKEHKLRVSGTNNELISRIYTHLKLSNYAVHIQKVFRGHSQRICNKMRGPGFLQRSKCTNDSDFLTMENMKDIPYRQFISFRDDDGFIYGFDILSLHNLKASNTDRDGVKNPYTRSIIDKSVFQRMKRLIKFMQKMYKVSLDIKIDREPEENMTLEERVNRVFMEIDSHGHYSSVSWFNTLDKRNLIRYVSELADIWYYRASLSPETRYMICPQDPFRHLNIFISMLLAEQNIDVIKGRVLSIIEAIITSGSTEQNRALGVLFVLQTFTLVNLNARESMPWLYEAVAYVS
jgi:hypothetical protein